MLLLPVAFPQAVHAQLIERICQTDYRLPSEKVGELSIELDNICFFKNNEFESSVIRGYSLPGLWVQPKFVYLPLKNIKLEAGIHALFYSGAYKYPNYAYQDISLWKGGQYQHGAHLLPYFRAQIAFSRFNLVWGNLYGGSNHGLIAPLYNPELNLTADPETGFQLLFDTRSFHLDAWINWQSFIFHEDTHQEAFTVGVSSAINFTAPEARVHCYMPIQLTIQHRGGEIDTLVSNSVHTLVNAAAGIGLTWNRKRHLLRRVNIEADVLGYYQQAGTLWPLDQGSGLYAKGEFDLGDHLRVQGGYFYGKDFISLYGIPFFGTVSMSREGATFDVMRTWCASIEYSRTFKQNYSMGAKADLYYTCPGTMRLPDGTQMAGKSGTSFLAGIYFRAHLDFRLLKKRNP